MKIIKDIAALYLRVDYRTLGIFRIALGIVCLVDVLRRIPYIDIFYSSNGLAPNYFMSEMSGKYSAKAFTFLSSLNTTTEITIFFYITALFSFFLMIGYKTKLSHIITLIGILSIHNRLIILENGGDLVLNNILIWSLFLPLGKAFSFDRMRFLLDNFKDESPKSLNDEKIIRQNHSGSYWGLAYFACLLQLAIIYIFNFFNKDGSTWQEGTSIFYFYQLDTFLTPLGNFIKEFGLMPLWLSKVLTSSTMVLEFLVPFLILSPFFTLWTRRFSLVAMIGFHVVIGISLYIGTFSWIMIAALLLLLSSKDFILLKGLMKKISSGPYIVFYDSDCGFCHQTARIIRRMDLFNNLTWAGKDWNQPKPDSIDNLIDTTIIVWDQGSNQIYTRHLGFSKIIESLPFGFLIAWILRVPGISYMSGFKYDMFSRNRTSISKFFGYSACNISKKHSDDSLINEVVSIRPIDKFTIAITESAKTIIVFILIIASVQYAFTKNDGFRDWLKDNGYKPFKYNAYLNGISKQTRMIQKWNMFSPNTPRSYQWCIIEGTLQDGTIIDLMTGEPPVYDSLGYDTYKKIDNSQFWRKYFSRIVKKNYKRYRPQFKKVILNANNMIGKKGDLNKDGSINRLDKIKSVKLYKLSKSINSPLIDKQKEKKVRKNKVDLDNKSNSKAKYKKTKTKTRK